MQINWQAAAVILTAFIFTCGLAAWVVRQVYALQTRLVEVETDLAGFKQTVNDRCQSRELWLKENTQVLNRVDKNLAVLASHFDLNIESK